MRRLRETGSGVSRSHNGSELGLVGQGFVGAHHVDAVRRLGFVDVVAIGDVTEERAKAKAAALGAVVTQFG